MTPVVERGNVRGGALRVGAAQAVAVPGDLTANVATAVRLVTLASRRQVRLLLLPEAFLTGYDLGVFAGPVPAPADLEGEALAPLRAAAAAHGVVVVLSTPLEREGVRTLTMVVLHPDGRVHAPYDKQHLDSDEQAFFTPGRHGSSITVDGVELGLAICYDNSFPEHARAAADDGAVGYLCSAAFFPGGAHRRDVVVAARALDHQLYVVLAAAVGGPLELIGGSSVVGPDGVALVTLGDEEGLAVADLDPAVVAATRAERPVTGDRRRAAGARRRLDLGSVAGAASGSVACSPDPDAPPPTQETP